MLTKSLVALFSVLTAGDAAGPHTRITPIEARPPTPADVGRVLEPRACVYASHVITEGQIVQVAPGTTGKATLYIQCTRGIFGKPLSVERLGAPDFVAPSPSAPG